MHQRHLPSVKVPALHSPSMCSMQQPNRGLHVPIAHRKSLLQHVKPVSSLFRAVHGTASAPTTEGPSADVGYAPTRVRVQHDTYIRASRAAVWALLQELTPVRRWPQVSVVLAMCESIYGVEYQGLAQQLLTAYQATNRPPQAPTNQTAGAAAALLSSPQQQAHSLQQQQQGQQHVQASEEHIHADRGVAQRNMQSSGGFGSLSTPAAASALTVDDDADSWDHLGGTSSASSSIDWTQHSSGSSSSSRSSSRSSNGSGSESARGGHGRSTDSSSSSKGGSFNGSSAGSSSDVSSGDGSGYNASQRALPSSLNAAPSGRDLHRSNSNSNSSNGSDSRSVLSNTPMQAVPGQDSVAGEQVADAVFMQLLLLLASKAGFVGLSDRDVQLGISLNTDYLWQLFVKVNTEQLDNQLVAPFVQGTGLAAPAAAAAAAATAANGPVRIQTAEESMLVLRRGYSSEQQRGRWLIQKLDYLQLLLIKRGFSGLLQLGGHTAQAIKAVGTALTSQGRSAGVGRRSSSNNRRSGSRPSRRSSGSSTLSNGNSSSKGSTNQASKAKVVQGRGSRNSSSAGYSRCTKSADGDAAINAAVATEANSSSGSFGAAGSGSQTRHTKVARSSKGRWLFWGNGRSSKDAFAPSVHSFGRPYQDSGMSADQMRSEQAAGDLSSHSSSSNGTGEGSDRGSVNASDTHSSSKVTDAVQAHDAAGVQQSGHFQQVLQEQQQQQEQEQELLQQQQEQHLLQEQDQQQQRRQPRRRPALLARLRTRVEDSLCRAAYTLSDWGLIPRMGATSLERFEQEFPLREAPRLQPLYIEKATLPDVLDPVLHARFPWLAPPSTTSSADGRINGTGGSTGTTAVTRAADGSRGGSISGGEAASSRRGVLQTFWQPVEVVEPTFRQLLVVYRRKPRVGRWRHLRERVLGKDESAPAARRNPIQLQVYRDIPLPSWQVVYPDKLLQFRPLDLLRLDLFGVAGATAALAQAKYNSIVLQLLTLVSLSVWATRLVLGYLRMDDRYKSIVAQLLADRTVASGEGGLEYIATAAGLQQFKQTALAYVLLHAADTPCEEEEIAGAAEALLQQKLQLQVRFNVLEALSELKRFGLLVEKQQSSSSSSNSNISSSSSSSGGGGGGSSHQTVSASAAQLTQQGIRSGALPAITSGSAQQLQLRPQETLDADMQAGQLSAADKPQQPLSEQQQQQQQQRVLYSVLGSTRSVKVLQQYWAGLLEARVGSILQDTGAGDGDRGVLEDTMDHLT